MSENMSDKWVDYAVRIQSIAQAGLAYCEDKYGRERYEELRKISAEMISAKTDIPLEKVYDLFCNESGYQTPKLDTRGAVFIDGKILLVRENNGTWSLPGGWCDVDLSVAENTEKEVLEETGLSVHCKKLIAVQDWRRHNRLNCPYGIMKFFVLCEYDSGEFKENIETTETRLFDRNALPDNLADEKTTAEQIRLCFEYYHNPHKETCLE